MPPEAYWVTKVPETLGSMPPPEKFLPIGSTTRDVATVDGQDLRHPWKTLPAEAGLLLVDFVFSQGNQLGGLVVGVLDRGDREEDLGMLHDRAAELRHVDGHVLEAGIVADLGALLLARPMPSSS